MAGKDYKSNQVCKYTYMCYNEKCNKLGKEVVVEKKYKDEYKSTPCKSCKEDMTNKGMITDGNFEGIVVAKVASMGKEDRAKILKKRSKNHFKKHIAEKRREMIKNTDSAFKKSLNS